MHTIIARQDVRLFPFYKLYKKEHILFTRLLCSIDFNKTAPFLTSTNIYYTSFNVKIDTLTSLQNCQIGEILISTHLMLFHSMKQSLIISSTGYFPVY